MTTNPLPPLPLIDGVFFADNTFMESFINCPRACEYKNLNKRRAADAQPALNFGGAIHAALDHRYRHSPDYVDAKLEAEQLDILTKWFAEKPNPIEDRRTLDLATLMIRGYNKHFLGEEFSVIHLDGKPAVELSFAFPFYTYKGLDGDIPIVYCGKIDIAALADDQLGLVDHKTTSIMGDGFFKGHAVSAQMYGYVWALQKTTNRKVDWFIINGLRVPKPTVKDGLISKPEDFQRLKTYVHDGQVEEWEFNTKRLLDRFFNEYFSGYMPQEKTHCVHKYGTCEYYDVCAVPRDNRELLLYSGQFIDNDWSPLQLNKKPTNENPSSDTN